MHKDVYNKSVDYKKYSNPIKLYNVLYPDTDVYFIPLSPVNKFIGNSQVDLVPGTSHSGAFVLAAFLPQKFN